MENYLKFPRMPRVHPRFRVICLFEPFGCGGVRRLDTLVHNDHSYCGHKTLAIHIHQTHEHGNTAESRVLLKLRRGWWWMRRLGLGGERMYTQNKKSIRGQKPIDRTATGLLTRTRPPDVYFKVHLVTPVLHYHPLEVHSPCEGHRTAAKTKTAVHQQGTKSIAQKSPTSKHTDWSEMRKRH